MIELENVSKTFTLHNQGGAVIEVLRDAAFGRARRMRGADRRVGRGQVHADADDLRQLPRPGGRDPHRRVDLVRRPSRARSSRCAATTLGYVSQFLRVVPRVPTLDVVAEPLRAVGARRRRPRRGRALLTRLNIPERSGRCRPRPSRAASSSA
jgi:alpha-D-ribose 1-methylphosphonate 5-triphosphate synthase subunit PhnL